MDWQDKIVNQLDRDQPNWAIDWATGDELRDYALNPTGSEARLRRAVANRLIHRIVSAAIGAGVVSEQS